MIAGGLCFCSIFKLTLHTLIADRHYSFIDLRGTRPDYVEEGLRLRKIFVEATDIASVQSVRYSLAYELLASQSMAFLAAIVVGSPFDEFDLRLGPEQDQLQDHSKFGADERQSANAGLHFAES